MPERNGSVAPRRQGRDSLFWLHLLQALFAMEVVVMALASSENGDEGFYIAASHLVSAHLFPFVGFAFMQGPLIPFLYAPFVRLLGPTLLATRILGVGCEGLLYVVLIACAARWAKNAGLRTKRYVPELVVTGLCILYPEVWGNLCRIGSKEAVASLCGLLSFACLLTTGGKPQRKLLLSAGFTAISVGIKYSAVVVVLPLALFIWSSYGLSLALSFGAYCFLGVLAVFTPYLITHTMDFVWANFLAVTQAISMASPSRVIPLNVGSGFIGRTALIILAFRVAALRFQLLMIPTLIYVCCRLRQKGLFVLLKDWGCFSALLFIYLVAAAWAGIMPDMIRIYMYVPLLILASAVAVTYFLDRFMFESMAVTGDILSGWPTRLSLAAILLYINSAFLFPFSIWEGGEAVPTFAAVRWYLVANQRSVRDRLTALCEAKPSEMLYVGGLQHLILSSRCTLSAYSSMPEDYIALSHLWPERDARKYRFLTSSILKEMLSRHEFPIVVVDNEILRRLDWLRPELLKDGYTVDYSGNLQTILRPV